MGTRFLYLVRHCQYHTDEGAPKHGSLTALGKRQARRVAPRLACLDLHVLHHSDMARAVETAEIIARELPATIPLRPSALLREGIPTAPVAWRPGFAPAEARRDRARIEKAYARYFLPTTGADRHEVLVAHANIIRYLVRRSMGDPIGKWAAMDITQGSLTVLAVVSASHPARLMSFNDVGHLPRDMCTFL